MKKILIFASHTGGGHISLAEAIRDLFKNGYEAVIVDPQPRAVNFHYRTVSRHALWLWEAEFKLTDGTRRARMAHELSKHTFAISILRAIRRVNPDLIISTYPFFTSEVMYAMRLFRIKLPFAMLFSDPNGVHRSWLTEKRAQATFAPTQETYQQALASGFDPQRTHFTGWPVRGQFYHALPVPLSHIGLDEKRFTVFLQGGGDGAARFARTVEQVLNIEKVQIILAAGTNRKLYHQFQGRVNIHVLPFTREIAPYMAAADVVMGKAGPNVLFESVTLGKPFIATAYIPGQEEVNLDFIRRHKLGWIALKHASQQFIIRRLEADRDLLQKRMETVETYRKMNTEATLQIPNLIDDFLKESDLVTV
jgi:UDP-N-acetylglucosamine:LPS N-acetylglucosamine transferase